MLSGLLVTRALLAAVAAADATNLLADPAILTADDVLYRPVSDLLTELMGAETDQQTVSDGNSSWSPEVRFADNGTADFSAWDDAAHLACVSRLQALHPSSSPSGHSICYNLAMLDIDAGNFVADVRHYQVTEVKGGLLDNVPSNQIQVEAAYRGANVSVMPEHSNENLTKRADSSSRPKGPVILQFYKLSGQIDKAKLENISISNLQATLLPSFALTAKSASGAKTSVSISPNEAAFVVGIFSKATVMSDYAIAQAAVNDQLAALQNGTIPFVIPGRHIMIFPIGAIITGTWLLIGLAVIGFGTFERIQHRRRYWRAVAHAAAGTRASLPPSPSLSSFPPSPNLGKM